MEKELVKTTKWLHLRDSRVLDRVILFFLHVLFTVGIIKGGACKTPPRVILVDNLGTIIRSVFQVIHLREILKDTPNQLYHPHLLLHNLSRALEEVEVEVLV